MRLWTARFAKVILKTAAKLVGNASVKVKKINCIFCKMKSYQENIYCLVF